MTEKRFTTGDYGKGIKLTDNVECEHYFWINEHDCEDLCTLLNELYDENQRLKVENEQLKSALKELKEIGDYQAERIKELNKENQHLKGMIKEAYRTERTQLGKSVLKQLIDQME